jgi:hypothetical protein
VTTEPLLQKLEDFISDLRHRKSKAYDTKLQLAFLDDLALKGAVSVEDASKFGQADFISTTLAEMTMKIHKRGTAPKSGGWYQRRQASSGSDEYSVSAEFSDAWLQVRGKRR